MLVNMQSGLKRCGVVVTRQLPSIANHHARVSRLLFSRSLHQCNVTSMCHTLITRNVKPLACLSIRTRTGSGKEEEDESFFFGKDFSLTIALTGVAAALYFGLQTFLLDLYWSYRPPLKHTSQDNLDPKVYSFLLQTIQESQLEENTIDMTQIHFDPKLYEPTHLGSLKVRAGVNIYLPSFYGAESIELETSKICTNLKLDVTRLESETDEHGAQMMETLKNALALSNQAKRFALLVELHRASQPIAPFFDTFCLFLVPAGVYRAATHFLPRLLPLPLFGLSCLPTLFLVRAVHKCQHRYALWAVAQFEAKQGDERSSDEKLEEGAQEFFDKLNTLQRIIGEYSTELKADFQLNRATKEMERRDWLRSGALYPISERLQDWKTFLAQTSRSESALNNSLYFLS